VASASHNFEHLSIQSVWPWLLIGSSTFIILIVLIIFFLAKRKKSKQKKRKIYLGPKDGAECEYMREELEKEYRFEDIYSFDTGIQLLNVANET
jgi:hypothetical protein